MTFSPQSTAPARIERGRSTALLAFFLATVCLACSSGSQPASGNSAVAIGAAAIPVDASGPEAAASCDPNLHPDTIAPGLTKAGDNGAFTFVIVSTNPQPPEPAWDDWVIKILDNSGQPVTDATLTLPLPYMPLHQHTGSVVSSWTTNSDGTYAIHQFFFMPGLWQVTSHAQSAAITDTVTYTFCAGQ